MSLFGPTQERGQNTIVGLRLQLCESIEIWRRCISVILRPIALFMFDLLAGAKLSHRYAQIFERPHNIGAH